MSQWKEKSLWREEERKGISLWAWLAMRLPPSSLGKASYSSNFHLSSQACSCSIYISREGKGRGRKNGNDIYEGSDMERRREEKAMKTCEAEERKVCGVAHVCGYAHWKHLCLWEKAQLIACKLISSLKKRKRKALLSMKMSSWKYQRVARIAAYPHMKEKEKEEEEGGGSHISKISIMSISIYLKMIGDTYISGEN